MSQENNFVPEQEHYKKLRPFQIFMKNYFPFIENTFMELDNYSLLCKITEYLNNVISNENIVESNVSALYEAFVNLNNYVSQYFDNLDVQEEIDNKLDELVEDGTFSRILNQELLRDLNNQIVQNAENIGTLNQEILNAVKTTDTNKVGMSMLTQEVRTALTGGSTAVVGINSINNENISNGAISIYKLDNLLNNNFTKEYENVSFGNAITGHYKYVQGEAITDAQNSNYNYYDVSLDNNTTYEFSGFNNFSVPAIIIYDSSDNSIVTYTAITDTSDRYENVHLLFRTNKSGLKAYINNRASYSPTTPFESMLLLTFSKITELTQNKKENYIEVLKTLDGYTMTNAENETDIDTIRLASNQYMSISIYKLSKGTKYQVSSSNIYNYPGIVIFNEDLVVSYRSSTEHAGTTPVPVTYEFTATNDGYVALHTFTYTQAPFGHSISIVNAESKYKFKKWTLIGDSLTDGNVNQSVKKYYEYVQDDLGIQIQNLGQSGCGYKRKYNSGNNFYEQSSLIDNDSDVVTIFGSFNDQNEFTNLGTANDTTTDTVLGSVYATLENIISNHQNTKIGIILPTPWASNGFYPQTTSSNVNTYIEGIKTIAKKFSVPVLDLYYESNMFPWKENFRNSFYVSSDGVHPNSSGNKRFAYQIEEFIKKII